MSIASEITRIATLRDRIRTKLLALGLLSDQDADLEDCTDAVEEITTEAAVYTLTATPGIDPYTTHTASWQPAFTVSEPGLVTLGVHYGSQQSVSAADLVSGTLTLNANVTEQDCTNYEKVTVAVPEYDGGDLI